MNEWDVSVNVNVLAVASGEDCQFHLSDSAVTLKLSWCASVNLSRGCYYPAKIKRSHSQIMTMKKRNEKKISGFYLNTQQNHEKYFTLAQSPSD